MGERLRRLRKVLGKSQKEMSAYLGLGEATWQNYELGISSPKAETIHILEQDGFDPNWIISGVGDMRKGALRVEEAQAAAPFGKMRGIDRQKIFKIVLKALGDAMPGQPGDEIAAEAFRITSEILSAAETAPEALEKAERIIREKRP
ncbi:MAG: helix-turn-helix domain-containing protein [Rickettsiales bacterium]|jgi:transcriptional regulator with XRE-family HTH domain|nr:helix-turn-helix domain-containing protein [Rickettsiales bacterium]